MSQRRVSVGILVLGFALVVPLVVLFAVSFGNDPHSVPFALDGQQAPAFELVDLEGRAVALEDFHGRPVVINFWATWCLPCKQEHPLLLEAPRRYPDVAFLGIAYADEMERVRRYISDEGTAFPQLVDQSGRVAIDYGVAGVPETYFIDPQGRIVRRYSGPLTPRILAETLGPMMGAM